MNPGDRIGHYEMIAAIGKGGMGEVWKALDTKLHREVAIKMLPQSLATDPDRLARFGREATLLAALNHPHIASIHGLEEAHGTMFLVLELVDGSTLSDRLQRGALPLKEALTLALQLAESLEAAHARGIIHRDLKPANIKVTREGRVKVLDFGLAKALEGPRGDDDATTGWATETGLIMGTPAYMSPEQARGQDVDHQADIWAFGVVLYELLTGNSPFRRPSAADTLLQVVSREPDFTLLRPETPASARRLLRRCLEKDPKRRFHAMSDVRLEIEDALAEVANPSGSHLATDALRARGRLPVVAGALTLVVIAGFAGWFVARRGGPDRATTPARLSLLFAEPPKTLPFGVNTLAISEDGSRIAYASVGRLWLRQMDQKDAVALGAAGASPFFSPDGQWVGLFEEGFGVVKVPVDGGPPSRIAPTTARSAGASWRAGTIVFATTEGLFQVSENGGTPKLITKANPEKRERLYAWPYLMPDGRSLLFTIVSQDSAEAMKVASLDLTTLEMRILLTRGTAARYVPTGHLLYAVGPTLRAVAFDAARHQLSGEPVTLPDIDVATAVDNGASAFAVSANGTLIFATPSGPWQLRSLYWVDRRGSEEIVPVEPRGYGNPKVSPDGTRVAFDWTVGGNRDIYVLDLRRLTLTRVTDGPTEDMIAIWAPDGGRVFFGSDRTGQFDVYSQAADGASGARLAFTKPGFQAPVSFTPDGRRLLFTEEFKDVGIVDLVEPPRVEPLFNSDANEWLGRVSPDGHWIAYESNEAGQQAEIWVRPFPQVGSRREKVSLNGGRYPLWGSKGSNELFYVNLEGEMMVAKVTTTPSLVLGPVSVLFRWQKPPAGITGMPYDISPIDGRLLITRSTVENNAGPTQVSVLLNWFERLREQAPAR